MLKKTIKLFIICFLVLSLIACEKKHYNEWVEKDGDKYYYDESNNMLKDVIKEIDGEKYAFDIDGKMIYNDFFIENGKKYYFDTNGKMSIDGLVGKKGDRYLVNKEGEILTGWQKIDDDWYYFNEDGKMLMNQWVGSGNDKYYVNIDGKMAKNKELKIDSYTYIFDSDGHSIKIKELWEKTFYVDDFGEYTKEAYVKNKSYFLGVFSNSATTNSKCNFLFLIDEEDSAVKLFEYGTMLVKEYDTDYLCSIKTDSGYTISFTGNNHQDRVTFDYVGKKALINCLKGSENFKLYIKEKSKYGTPSTYLVEVEPDNFKYVWWK